MLVLVLSLSTWLAFDVQAREQLLRWVKTAYGNVTDYLFDSEEKSPVRQDYYPAFLVRLRKS